MAFDAREMQKRYRAGDGCDWVELWHRGDIDEYTMFERTGYRAIDIAIVAVPREVAVIQGARE